MEGVPASRQLTDQVRRAQREIVLQTTTAAGILRAREQADSFSRHAVLKSLIVEVNPQNAHNLARLLSSLNEVIGVLSEGPADQPKTPSCVTEAITGAAAGGSHKRPIESLGALGIESRVRRQRLPTPPPSNAVESETSPTEEGTDIAGGVEETLQDNQNPPLPNGPPDEEEGILESDTDVANFLEECLSPDSDFSLSPR